MNLCLGDGAAVVVVGCEVPLGEDLNVALGHVLPNVPLFSLAVLPRHALHERAVREPFEEQLWCRLTPGRELHEAGPRLRVLVAVARRQAPGAAILYMIVRWLASRAWPRTQSNRHAGGRIDMTVHCVQT